MERLENDSLFGLIHSYLKNYLPKQRGASKHTIRSYRKALDLLVDFVRDKKKIPLIDVSFEMLDAKTIADFLSFIESDRGCSVNTRNLRLTAVRSFLKYASDTDVSTVTFLKEIKKVPLKKPTTVKTVKYMSEAAIATLISQPDVATAKGLRDRFFIILMYDTAARVEEMLRIKPCDFRFGKNPTVTLHGKYDKLRTVPLMEKTVLHLRQYLSVFHSEAITSEAPLFYSDIHGQVNPLSDDCVRKFLRKYGAKAQKNHPEISLKTNPHAWRHSRAMHLYQRGMDLTLLSQWLGHEHIETTLIYAHADTEQKRRAIESATSGGKDSPINLGPKRFTINDDDTLKRLAGLK